MRVNFGGAKTIVDAAKLPKWPVYYQALRGGEDASTLKPTKYEVNAAINEKIVLWRGDITALKIDGIVNAANSELWAGGGICGAIHKAAGPRLEQACDKIGSCPTGQTVITPGFKLPSSYVLHSVGPTNRNAEALESCYRTIMEVCVKNKVRSVCMCCISTGIFGFPNEPACIIALSTVRKFLEDPQNQKAIDLVVFCTFLIEDVKLYDAYTPVFFPIEHLSEAPETENETYCGSLFCWQYAPCSVHADGKMAEHKTGMEEESSPRSRKEGSKRPASVLTSISPQSESTELESKSSKPSSSDEVFMDISSPKDDKISSSEILPPATGSSELAVSSADSAETAVSSAESAVSSAEPAEHVVSSAAEIPQASTTTAAL